MFQMHDRIFDAQFFALEIVNGSEVRRRAADFAADDLFETTMLGPKIFDTV